MMSIFQLTPQQSEALDQLQRFMVDDHDCFILQGSAGTGKTSLLRFWLERLEQQQLSYQLLAPTGRAARILSTKTGCRARTIHSFIYRLDKLRISSDDQHGPELKLYFPLRDEYPPISILLIDEASMLGNRAVPDETLQFGSGQLLNDLLSYAGLLNKQRGAFRVKVVFVGDSMQLPPVGEQFSAALDKTYLRETFKLRCTGYVLTEVMRQQQHSAVLKQATEIRQAIKQGIFNRFRLPETKGQIESCSVHEAVSQLVENYRQAPGTAIMVTYSNQRAYEINAAVRENLWGAEPEPLYINDWLLINKNALQNDLFNGDRVQVVEMAPQAEIHRVPLKGVAQPVELKFRAVTLLSHDHSSPEQQRVIDCRILENLLDSPERELTPTLRRAMLVDFIHRHPKLALHSAEFRLAIAHDPWFNAVQVKYGYAMTCHKAQGGEWETVAIDFSGIKNFQNRNSFRWCYTALTRSRHRVLTLNAPSFDAYSKLVWQASPNAIDADTSATDGLDDLKQRVLAVLANTNITVHNVSHYPYCERYELGYGNHRCSVDFHYNKQQRVSKISLPKSTCDPQTPWIKQVLAEFERALLNTSSNSGQSLADSNDTQSVFLQDLIARIENSTIDEEIRLLDKQLLPFRYRLTFAFRNRTAKLDFIYDAKQNWKTVLEVGKPGSSFGLLERMQTLMCRERLPS